MTIKIALDAGHALYTAGKQTPNGIKEWVLNDKVRDKIVEYLRPYNVEIIHTDNNEGNIDESLSQRVKKYKSAGVSAFISIHHNAYTGSWNGATGVEIYTDKNPTNEDLRLADCIYGRLVNYTELKGRGIKQANFQVINQNDIPAVLIEGGFMDSTNDYNIITSKSGQDAYARAVAEGLIEYLKLEIISDSVQTTSTVNDDVRHWQTCAIADGFIFAKYGADGKWGKECEAVAKQAICKKRTTYKYKNLTKIVQRAVGVTADGLFGSDTKNAVVKFQKLVGLNPDGCVGLNTWKKILGV